MITAILNIIILILGLIVAKTLDLFRWYGEKIRNVPKKPWNILRILLATAAICYAVSRIGAVRDLGRYQMQPPGYSQKEMEYLNQKRIERCVRLQQRTDYFNRYNNVIAWCYYTNRPTLAMLYIGATYSNNAYRFHRHVYEQHMARLYLADRKEYERRLETAEWMEPDDKHRFTRTIMTISADQTTRNKK